MRYTYNNSSLERVNENINKNSIVEREPITDHGKKFHTRVREISKEIGHGNFRLKSHSTIDRLNYMYQDDLKILDCEKN